MQCAIDGVKREYAVDPNDEIARIRDMKCMQRKKDFPLFMKYTHKIPVTKNGKERSYEDIKKDRDHVVKRIDKDIICPMNYLQTALDKIQGAPKKEAIDTAEFFVKIKGTANNRQMSKIREMIEKYDAFVRYKMIYIQDKPENFDEILERTELLLEQIKKIKISAVTMNRLIETCLGVMGRANKDSQYSEAVKYMMRTFNILYQANKERFLSNFQKKDTKIY
jgi:hypothetical protein